MLLLLLISFAGTFYGWSQTASPLTGTVKDFETGEPVAGATISVKGKDKTVVADGKGAFTIDLQETDHLITVSGVGYEPIDVTVSGKTTITINLTKKENKLDEVVVIGYGEVKRKDVTGSVGSVNVEELQKAPVGSAIEALAGRVAGVQVSSESGKPGSGLNIVVRGANSLTQDNAPLYVIDGFPTEDANASVLNPSEIESIEVLKDASATAIYGARGANGVIMITTKKGKEGPPVINYAGYAGVQEVINRMKMMDAYEFVKLQNDIDSVGIKLNYLSNGKTLESYKSAEGIDWQDMLFRQAPMQNHTLSFAGGTKSTRYSVSGNLFDQQGVIINSGFNRKQGKITLDQTFSTKFKAGINASYTSATTFGANPATPESNFSAMNYLMYSVWGYRPLTASGDLNLVDLLVDPDINGTNDYRINPIMSAENEYRRAYDHRLIVNAYAEYAFTKNLKLRVSGGINNRAMRNEAFNNSKTRYGYAGSVDKVNGSILYTDNNSWLNENILTYNKAFKGGHRLTAMAGLTLQENEWTRYGMSAVQLPNEMLGLAGLSQGTARPVTSLAAEWSLVSLLSRINYDYKGKYLITASYRSDGSSKFLSNRWGYFPSAAFAWRIIKESFMEDQTILSDAKLRLGYGVTGNNRISEYAGYAQISFDNSSPTSNGYYSFGNVLTPGAFLGSMENRILKWESTAQSNLGLDLGFLNQRLLLTVDYYKKTTSDLLLLAALPPTIGYASAFKNIGKTQNEGLEFSLSSDIIKQKNFDWNANFNIAFNRNKVLALTENQESILSAVNWDQNYRDLPLYIAKINQPLGQIYGYIWEGVYQYNDFDLLPTGAYQLKESVATNGNSRANIKPGDIKYRDINGDGVVNNFDRTVIGRSYPLHQGGLTNNFRYRNFDLSVFMQWSYGNDVVNANRLWFEYGAKANLNQFATYENRWTPANTETDMFRVGGQGPFAYSSRIVEDGSYLRLKTASLGYTIPATVLQRAKIKSLRIYASAQNLLTFTKYTGYDPEVAVYYSALTPGFDYSAYPRPRTFVFGLNLAL